MVPSGAGSGRIGRVRGAAIRASDAPVEYADNGEKQATDKRRRKNPLLAVLKAKVLPETETMEPVEGLLYFLIDGKFKQKDLALIYKGQAGRLTWNSRTRRRKSDLWAHD